MAAVVVALTNGVKAILKSYFIFLNTTKSWKVYFPRSLHQKDEPNYKSRQLDIFNFGAASLVCFYSLINMRQLQVLFN